MARKYEGNNILVEEKQYFTKWQLEGETKSNEEMELSFITT